MFVDLIEHLRCPNAHQESPLVATAARTVDRHLLDGTLGCPVCDAVFPVNRGVAYFAAPSPASAPVARPSADTAMRLAAFLDLTDRSSFALLLGTWASQTDQIARLTETPIVIVNPIGAVEGDAAAILVTGATLPVAAGSARAAALDIAAPSTLRQSIVHAVRSGGRIVGPVGLELPSDVTELARDEHFWIAQKNAAPDPAPRFTLLGRPRRG